MSSAYFTRSLFICSCNIIHYKRKTIEGLSCFHRQTLSFENEKPMNRLPLLWPSLLFIPQYIHASVKSRLYLVSLSVKAIKNINDYQLYSTAKFIFGEPLFLGIEHQNFLIKSSR